MNKNTSSCNEWDAAMKAYAVASNIFDNVTDKHLVDVATYELKAAEMRLNAVLAGLRDKPNWGGVREVKPNAK